MERVPAGPYISVARFCDNILTEVDGMKTLIRLLEGTTITVTAPPDVDQEALDALDTPWPVPLKLYVSAVGFPSAEPTTLEVEIRRPDGTLVDPPLIMPFEPSGSLSGINIEVNVSLGVRASGLFSFDIRHQGRFLTSVPLQIVVDVRLAPDDVDLSGDAIVISSDPDWQAGRRRQMTIVSPEPQGKASEPGIRDQ